MITVTYGTNTFDFGTLPAQSLEAMVKRGVAHFFGNEVAAKVTAWKKKFADENGGAQPGDDEVAAKHAEVTADFHAKLVNGTVGISTRGPAQDPVEAEMERIARRDITQILKTAGAKWTGKGDDRKVTFADGSQYTMDELVDRRLANPEHQANIRKAAERAIKDAAKAAEKAKAAGPLDASAIG